MYRSNRDVISRQRNSGKSRGGSVILGNIFYFNIERFEN